ncbi:MAG: PKD domain-containing protein, partial [Thermoplasmata archaeon]
MIEVDIMERKSKYAIVAVIVVIVIIVAAAAVILIKPTTTVPTTPAAPTLVSVKPSTQLTTAGSSIQFTASITGNVTSVSWNFGDGTTATGLSVTHTYTEPGSYLVFVNASGPSGYANNLKSLIPISISPESVSPLIASEITQPVLTLNTTLNPNAPIY